MMESIIQENTIHFKEFEKKIFRFVCELGQEIARTMLEITIIIWLRLVIQKNIEIKENVLHL